MDRRKHHPSSGKPGYTQQQLNVPVDPGALPRDKEPVRKTFIPCGNLVAIDVHRFDRTEAGVLLPDGSRDERSSPFGLVIAVGPDCKWVKEGDIVLGQNNIMMAEVRYGGSGAVFVVNENQILGYDPEVRAKNEEKSSSTLADATA